ncbi:Ubiquitin ligase E3 alpha, putative isoform 1 [Theobroma cacao]|uniref:E3 ubiquitin-protein ligase n=1 Tax=Theobroma cacao TaxID=3641 RepID=A0A061ESZ0_THECC|nr:Ubiquitin ligase E3 alpha, putative isoform 1 [Theobroma cacao]EOY07523.1 Ubiquitin ligase E3 alpha, putative isoform 1 [Theobroma cacao]
MESPSDSSPLKPRDRILRRLAALGIPVEYLERRYEGIVDFVMANGLLLPNVVSAILPTDEEVAQSIQDPRLRSKKWMGLTMISRFRDSMVWLQWLMFEGDPVDALKSLAKLSIGQRGVCGAVWGSNDIAYRCRTCEHDPTCAICVPCFQNGNHKDHDYSIIYTGGGCCDCGDETAWKREGFCSKHKGAEQIQPLPENLVNSVGPVLDALFVCWKNKLFSAESIFLENIRANDPGAEQRKIANELTYVVVEMLLEFCKYSESLLSFVSRRVISLDGLLGILVRAERFLSDSVVKKLHELLLKLLGEPVFKFEFSKVFLSYYPTVINEVIKEGNDKVLSTKFPLLSTFSVQIFTVPTLTPRLVKEMNLLGMLLGCLEEIFVSCAREDGHLQAAKWGSLYDTTNRVVGDIRFVMSHNIVSKYATHEQQDISRTWLKLLAFVQGMNPIKRETGLRIEEENESMHLLFVLGHSIANIHSLLVDGAVATSELANVLSYTYKQDMDDGDSMRHAKVGRLSQESSVCSVTGRTASKVTEVGSGSVSHLFVPSSVIWLIRECLRAMETWLEVDDRISAAFQSINSPNSSGNSDSNFLAIKKTLYKIRKGKYFGKPTSSSENHSSQSSSSLYSGHQASDDMEIVKNLGSDGNPTFPAEISSVACGSMCLDVNAMETDIGTGLSTLRVSEWPDIIYDVSSQEISVHIPLHRLLSLLLQKALRMCYGESVVPNVRNPYSTSSLSAIYADFFGHILESFHPFGFSACVMEHPLRIRVFCAQVIAGMWRKNGDAALVSCEWYRSVRWSEQGLELDLFLLQCCAALAPPDLFVKRIVERFGLLNYLSLSLERSNEYEPVLVQEMLTLIMQILQERRFCGRNTADSLKRELIYKLAIGDATHSQLVKSLPRDLSKFDQLQEILDRVAVYCNPSGFNQGMYSLRWAYWKELDLYHPRWNPRDLQVAEERYLRFCGVSAMTTQLPRWTKIYPPLEGVSRIATCRVTFQIIRAVLFYAVFTDKFTESRAPDGILWTALHLLSLTLDICLQQNGSSSAECYIGDLNCMLAFAVEEISESLNFGAGKQSLLSLLVALMRMHRQENQSNYLESSNCSFSPLIESILKKFAEVDSQCMTKLQQLAPEVICHISQTTPYSDTNRSVSASDSEMRKAKARERQAAILAKMKAEQSKFLTSITSTADDDPKSESEMSNSDAEHETEGAVQESCSLCHDPTSKNPVSFLILLQKSRLLSFVDRGPPSWDRWSDKEQGYSLTNRSDQPRSNASSSSSGLASQSVQLTDNAVVGSANDGQGQRREVNVILDFVKSRFPLVRAIQAPSTSSDVKVLETLEEDMYVRIRKEMCDTFLSSSIKEDEVSSAAECSPESSRDAESVFLRKYIAAISKETSENSLGFENTNGDREMTESTSQPLVYDGFGPLDCDGIYLSSCGHAVHQGCLDRYLSSLKERYVRRSFFEGAHIVDPDQGEFLCPVCRRLANSVLPAVHGNLQKAGRQPMTSSVDPLPALCPSSASKEESYSLLLQQGLSLLKTAAKVVGRPDIFEALSLQRKESKSRNLEPISRVLSKMYFSKKQDRLLRSPRLSHPIILWDTLKYSLMSTEIAARSGRTSMTTNYTLTSLYKEFKSSSEFIFSLLLRVVQNLSSTNSLHALQRFRGLQLFAESICSRVSPDYHSSRHKQEGNLGILKHDDKEAIHPDIQFWNRASDPVLARDPFSSLMWVLFCLPCPFISCDESLLSLVHIFYVVSMVQAVITCCGRHGYNINELDSHDCLITDICGILGGSDCARWYFVSKDANHSCDIKDMIRRLSFPYLRRCALLWKLLKSSAEAPFCDRDNVWESSQVTTDVMDTTESASVELNEVQELEKMFKIPPIDVVLKDEVSRSIALKWFHHFHKVYEACSFQNVFYCNPAVPFKLMSLPHVYQDLLQRYIKQCCPDCEAVLEDPALCLLCGRLCSPSWKPCCRDSGCMAHAMVCGAGIGVFLLIRRTTILLQRCARQAPWPSPYLDAFGEEDSEMHRGKPLYLNEERYAALTYMVASHGLDRSSKVLSQITVGSFFMV